MTKVGTQSQYYLRKYNPIEKMRTFEFTKDVSVYYGRVAHGKGYQILFPQDVNPADVLKFIEEHGLK